MAAIQTIGLYKGEDIKVIFTMKPVENVEGWDTVFTVRRAYNSPDILIQAVGNVEDAAGGVFQVNLPRSKTNVLPTTCVYDFVRVDSGKYTVLSTGTFVVKTGVRTR